LAWTGLKTLSVLVGLLTALLALLTVTTFLVVLALFFKEGLTDTVFLFTATIFFWVTYLTGCGL